MHVNGRLENGRGLHVSTSDAELHHGNVSFSSSLPTMHSSASSRLLQSEVVVRREKSGVEVRSKEGSKTSPGKHLRVRSSSKSELSKERPTTPGEKLFFLDRLQAGRSGSRPNSRQNSRANQKRFQSWQMSEVFANGCPARRNNLATLSRSEAWALSAEASRADFVAEMARQPHSRKLTNAFDPATEPGLNHLIPPDVIQDDDDGEYFDTGAAYIEQAARENRDEAGPLLDMLFNSSAVSVARHSINIKRKTKRETLAKLKPPTLEERKDTYYGLPDLSEKMAQMHRFYFKSAALGGDEASKQRLKKVFLQFRKGNGIDVMVEDLRDILEFLGFIVNSEDDMMTVLRSVTHFDELDLGDFTSFIENYTISQFEYWKKLFEEFDEEGSGEVSVSQLRQILSKMGYVVIRPMIEEGIAIVDDGNGELSFEEFVQFLVVYNHTEGFPQQDLESMFKVYHDFAGKRGFKELQSRDLPDALVAVFGFQAERSANIIGRLGHQAVAGITFPDFLLYAKRLRLAEYKDYKAEFEKYDVDGSGSIDMEELSELMNQLGYTPMRDVIEEILQEVNYGSDDDLDFEEFFHFMMVFRHRDGFTLKELDRLLQVFEKYDYDKSDTIDVHELGDMLRYLGYQVALEDLRILIGKVDVNEDGTLDSTEYTRLMRIYREKELATLKDIFNKHSHGKDMLSVYDIPFAVQAYLGNGVHPTKFAKTSAKKAVDFDDFVGLADKGQWKKVQSEQKKAGFSSSELQTLRDMFKKYDADGSGDIDALEVVKLLQDFGLKCRTREERQQSLDQVDEARKLAEAVGVLRDEETEDAFMTFWELVQLVRLLKTQQAKQSEEQGRNTMKQLRFSKQEIDEFRMVFLRWARSDGRKGSIVTGRRTSVKQNLFAQKSAEHMLQDNDASLSLAQLQKLIVSLGVRLTLQHKLEIEKQIAQMGATNDKGRLTFVGFLQLTQWMMDTSFAGLDAATSKTSH